MNKRIKKKKSKQFFEQMMISIPGPYDRHGFRMTVGEIRKHRVMTVEEIHKHRVMNIFVQMYEGPYRKRNFRRAFKSFYKNRYQILRSVKPFQYLRFAQKALPYKSLKELNANMKPVLPLIYSIGTCLKDPLGPIKSYEGLITSNYPKSNNR